jgi:hypothetical protein
MTLAEVVGTLKIDENLKQKFTRMATIFEDNIESNISKTHFELSKDTGIPYDEWGSFISITEIAGWINETMRVMARAGERKLISDLGRGGSTVKDVNAYKAIKEFNEQNNNIDNSNIVIMYLPPEGDE